VGWIALRAFAYHGTPLEIWTSKDNPALPARGGRPLQVFVVLGLSGAERNARGTGARCRFVAAFAHVLEDTGWHTREEAMRVAETILPDVLQSSSDSAIETGNVDIPTSSTTPTIRYNCNL
jgi:hypothetical protein